MVMMMTMEMITKPTNILLDEHGSYYHDDHDDDDCNEYDNDHDNDGDNGGDDDDNEDDNETCQHIAG